MIVKMVGWQNRQCPSKVATFDNQTNLIYIMKKKDKLSQSEKFKRDTFILQQIYL